MGIFVYPLDSQDLPIPEYYVVYSSTALKIVRKFPEVPPIAEIFPFTASVASSIFGVGISAFFVQVAFDRCKLGFFAGPPKLDFPHR